MSYRKADKVRVGQIWRFHNNDRGSSYKDLTVISVDEKTVLFNPKSRVSWQPESLLKSYTPWEYIGTDKEKRIKDLLAKIDGEV